MRDCSICKVPISRSLDLNEAMCSRCLTSIRLNAACLAVGTLEHMMHCDAQCLLCKRYEHALEDYNTARQEVG